MRFKVIANHIFKALQFKENINVFLILILPNNCLVGKWQPQCHWQPQLTHFPSIHFLLLSLFPSPHSTTRTSPNIINFKHKFGNFQLTRTSLELFIFHTYFYKPCNFLVEKVNENKGRYCWFNKWKYSYTIR